MSDAEGTDLSSRGLSGGKRDRAKEIVTVLEPEDEYPHTPDEAENYNESMYLNAFDPIREVGGWFRMGNRVNEGYAEMSVCVYLPGGRVGFGFGRPHIATNDEMRAGGLHIEVIEPFSHLRVTYSGQILLLATPSDMADPRQAYKDHPMVDCEVELDIHGCSPMYGGKPVYANGTELPIVPGKSFAKAHYEQHTTSKGTIKVGEEVLVIDGLGLRDKSWGPRYWQAVDWYRWLPMSFGPDFSMMVSVIGTDDPERPTRESGMVLVDGDYKMIKAAEITSDWDDAGYQTALRVTCTTEDATYEITGEALSLIPLRNRRKTGDGEQLQTRITEALTRYVCTMPDGSERTGIGMSEYLDQIGPDGPTGIDVVLGGTGSTRRT